MTSKQMAAIEEVCLYQRDELDRLFVADPKDLPDEELPEEDGDEEAEKLKEDEGFDESVERKIND